MKDYIFLLYIVTILISSLSIFASILFYFYKKQIWLKYFIHLLLVFLLMVIIYTIFYFIFLYSYRVTAVLDKILLVIVIYILSYMLGSSLLLGFAIKEIEITNKIRTITYTIILCYLFFSTFIVVIENKNIINIFLFVIDFLIIILLLLSLIKFKTLIKNNDQKIIAYLIILSLILAPIEIAEYIIRKDKMMHDTYIPMGAITFAFFCLLLNLINFIITLPKIIYSKKMINQNPHVISDTLIKKYKISNSEKKILLKLQKGLNNKEIAWELKISTRTVEKHIYNIYRKCSISNRIELLNLINSLK